jgi:hypothetical protein
MVVVKLPELELEVEEATFSKCLAAVHESLKGDLKIVFRLDDQKSAKTQCTELKSTDDAEFAKAEEVVAVRQPVCSICFSQHSPSSPPYASFLTGLLKRVQMRSVQYQDRRLFLVHTTKHI